jgi:hypothetical protein
MFAARMDRLSSPPVTGPISTAILDCCPELAAIQAHVRAFARMMTERRDRDLENWMTEATTSERPSRTAVVRHRAAP